MNSKNFLTETSFKTSKAKAEAKGFSSMRILNFKEDAYK